MVFFFQVTYTVETKIDKSIIYADKQSNFKKWKVGYKNGSQFYNFFKYIGN